MRAESRRAWERRSVSISRNVARNTVLIRVELPAEEGELVALALDRAVVAGDVAQGIEFGADREKPSASWQAQQADAFVAVMRSYLDGGDGERGAPTASTAEHCQVVVHADASALHGGDGRSDLPLETIKRLTCDCSLVAVIEDERGNPLDAGRKQRTVSTPLRRALWARDRGCTFPGCHRKRYVDGHHIEHWADGGETSSGNMTHCIIGCCTRAVFASASMMTVCCTLRDRTAARFRAAGIEWRIWSTNRQLRRTRTIPPWRDSRALRGWKTPSTSRIPPWRALQTRSTSRTPPWRCANRVRFTASLPDAMPRTLLASSQLFFRSGGGFNAE